MFHVVLRQAGPEFDPALPLEQQSGWEEHAAFMDSLVHDGHIVLGGTLPNGRTAHAMEAGSEEELRAIWARDPWYESHLVIEELEPWTIRLDGRPPGDAGIPWDVTLRGWLLRIYRPAWRRHWVRYWESQGISEQTQMEWAAEERARERPDGD